MKQIKKQLKNIQLKHSEIPVIREQLLKKQNGKCPVCSRQIRKPVLDHHHKKRIKGTGLVRGVVCNQCNILIAKSENNSVRYGIPLKQLPNILRAIADYLEMPQTNYIHPSERPKDKILKKQSYNKLKTAWQKNPGRKRKFPEYKKKQKITKELIKLFERYDIKWEFYK